MSPATQFINAVSSCLQIVYFCFVCFKVDNSASVLKPTPVRPTPYLHGKQLQKHLSVSTTDNHQDVTRPPKVSHSNVICFVQAV